MATLTKSESLGNRPTAECVICYHRGHAKNAVKICPVAILRGAIECLLSRRRKKPKVEECNASVDRLEKRWRAFPEADPRVQELKSLVKEYKEATLNYEAGKCKYRVVHYPQTYL